MGLMDRINAGIETLGKKANQALDEGRLRVELMRVRRRKDNAARNLGYIVWRQAKGTVPAEGETDFLIRKIDEADVECARLEEEIRKVQLNQPAAPGGDATPQP